MHQFDGAVITTALPSMAESLGEDPLKLNLAITCYLLSLAVFVPISGWMADRFGAKPVFIWLSWSLPRARFCAAWRIRLRS